MKKGFMVSLDNDTHEKAKANPLINISDICERALRQAIGTTIKDVSEEQLRFKCAQCFNTVSEGFLCTLTNKSYCLKCHDTYNWKICDFKEHNHLRIPFTKGRDVLSEENINFEKKTQ